MKIIPFICLILASFVSAAFSGQTSNLEALTERISGYQYQRQGDLSLAADHYLRSIALDPFYACPHNDLGTIYEARKKYTKAEQEYLKAIELDPRYLGAYANLAMVYEKQGKFNSAMQYWKMRASYGEPNDLWTKRAADRAAHLVNKYGSAEGLRKAEEALKEPRKEQAKTKYNFGPRSPDGKQQAEPQLAVEQPPVIEKPKEEVITQSPKQKRAKRSGKMKRAREVEASQLLMAHEIAQDIARQRELEILNKQKDASLAYQDGLKAYNSRNYKRAVECLNRALVYEPMSVKINTLLQKAQLKLEGKRQDSYSAEAGALSKGKNFYKEGKLKEAAKQFKKVLAINPSNRDAAMYLGLINASSKTS